MHRVTIKAGLLAADGQRYDTYFEDKMLLEGSQDPEYDSCRALLEQGKAGRIDFLCALTGVLRSSIGNLAAGAQLGVRQANNGTPITYRKTTKLKRNKEKT